MFFKKKDAALKLTERVKQLGLINNQVVYAMELQAALNPDGQWGDRKYILNAANHYLNEVEKQALKLAKAGVSNDWEYLHDQVVKASLRAFEERIGIEEEDSEVDSLVNYKEIWDYPGRSFLGRGPWHGRMNLEFISPEMK